MGLPKLDKLNVRDSRVSEAGIQALKKERPTLKINVVMRRIRTELD